MPEDARRQRHDLCSSVRGSSRAVVVMLLQIGDTAYIAANMQSSQGEPSVTEMVAVVVRRTMAHASASVLNVRISVCIGCDVSEVGWTEG